MTTPAAAVETGDGGVLRGLRAAAAVKRAARHRVADALTAHGPAAVEVSAHRAAHDVATARWVGMLCAAAAAGHPVSVIARAAGVTTASVHYRLPQAAGDGPSDGVYVTGGQVRP